MAELEAGNYVITNEPPILISAIGAIPKSDSDEVRLIHDCSRPTDNSLNSHNTGNETFKFQTMDNALKHIKTGSYLVKVDIHKAYRHVPVHPLNYRAAGLVWQFELKENQEFEFTYLYDTKLPFGASKALGIFHRLSQATTRIMRSKGFTVTAYLDDFLLIEDSYERCLESFNTLIDLLQTLGFSINGGKVVYPCQRLTFLGVEIDTISRQLTLPKRKIAEIRDIYHSYVCGRLSLLSGNFRV